MTGRCCKTALLNRKEALKKEEWPAAPGFLGGHSVVLLERFVLACGFRC
jgi:hypothetical protein